MATTIIVQDERVKANIWSFPGESNVMKTTARATPPLNTLVSRIVEHAHGQPIKVLRLYGHGKTRGGVGYGMQLGREDLSTETLLTFLPLRGAFEAEEGRIELRSCQVARGASIQGSDSYIFLKSLALLTMAYVYAADENQLGGGPYSAWAGNVWIIPPYW